jgi:hypothetical protein
MILPISLLSCLIGGCHHPVAHLSFSDILNEKANHAYIKTSDVNEYDYNFKIRDIIKDYSDSVKKQTFFKDGNENNLWMEFDIDPYNANDFDSLKIYFYNDGRVNTICSGASMLSGAYTQKTSYIMNEKQLDSLRQEVNARIEEVDRIEKEEEAKAREYATTERFFELLDNPPEGQRQCIHAYLNGISQFSVIDNFTPELKQDLKNLDYKEVNPFDTSNVFSTIDVILADNWAMNIYSDIPNASFYYTYDNTLTLTGLTVTFSINAEMRDALISRCREMVNNHTNLVY